MPGQNVLTDQLIADVLDAASGLDVVEMRDALVAAAQAAVSLDGVNARKVLDAARLACLAAEGTTTVQMLTRLAQSAFQLEERERREAEAAAA